MSKYDQIWPNMAKFSLDNLQYSIILPTHHFREAFEEKKWSKNSFTPVNSILSRFGARIWPNMAKYGQIFINIQKNSLPINLGKP